MAGPDRNRGQGETGVTLGRAHLNRSILGMAVPALGALAIDPLLTLVDTAFVARVGVVELAALGVDTAILGIAFFGFNFLAYATTPLVAQALGRRNNTRARRIVGDALILAVGLGVVTTIGLILLAPWIVDLMGAKAGVVGPAVTYLRVRALATTAVLVVTTGHGAFRGHQDTRTPLMVAAVVNGLNLILDPIFIFWLEWGLTGAAIATVIAQSLGAAWFVRLLITRSMASRPAGLGASIPTLLELGRYGALVSLRTSMLLIAFTVAAAAATRIGPEEIAAHQVVMQTWLLAAMLADSFAVAAQALVGEAAGSGDRALIDRLSSRLVAWGALEGLLLAVVFVFGSSGFGLLIEDPAVSSLAAGAGRVAGWALPVASPLFVADGIFLGLLALGTVVASTASGAALAVGLMLLTPLGQTLDGIWWAIGAMLVMRMVVLVSSYQRAVVGAVRS
jgi:putative MATE family efflux protein